ncbi:hypothetical protein C8Q79DRAFT_159934 [Trametes meyenii]|nr:hypothetical protein C8Q79DRAFT_159934 [Trametes meyenii]
MSRCFEHALLPDHSHRLGRRLCSKVQSADFAKIWSAARFKLHPLFHPAAGDVQHLLALQKPMNCIARLRSCPSDSEQVEHT